MKIGVLVGSVRQASWNKKIAKTLIEIAPSSLDMTLIEIG